jgi:hypothetical protein
MIVTVDSQKLGAELVGGDKPRSKQSDDVPESMIDASLPDSDCFDPEGIEN